MTIDELKQIEPLSLPKTMINKIRKEVIDCCQKFITDLDRDTFKNVFNIDNNVYTVKCPIMIYRILTTEIGFDPEMILSSGEEKTVQALDTTMLVVDKMKDSLNTPLDDLKISTVDAGTVFYGDVNNEWNITLMITCADDANGNFKYGGIVVPVSYELRRKVANDRDVFKTAKNRLASAIQDERLRKLFLDYTVFDTTQTQKFKFKPHITNEQELKDMKDIFDIISNVEL